MELGINFIDTAWYYGPLVANRLIAEALHPYPRDLVIATKLGGKRLPDKGWAPALRPEELRKGAEEDLRTLRLERLDVVHLRYMPGAGVPLMESLDALLAMQAEGKIRHLALSNVNARELEQALARTPIVAVQNMFNVSGGGGAIAKQTHSEVDDPEGVLDLCTRKNIAYLPFFPLAVGNVAQRQARARRDRREARRLARADRARLAPRALARHAADPGHQLGRAPRGELGRAPHRPLARRGRRDRQAGIAAPDANHSRGGAASASAD